MTHPTTHSLPSIQCTNPVRTHRASIKRRRSAERASRRNASSQSTFGSILGALLKSLVVLVLALALLAIAFFFARGFGLYREALDATALDDMATSMRASSGFTPINELPDLYLQAVVAVEDHRFYAHPGFDAIATARALVNDIKAGTIVEGGSTITQQLAKNQYFTQEQTIERKIAEVFMAFTMEQHLSKREILELYVNSIYFGDGHEGIGDASWGYFNKQPSHLAEEECAMLAGIPNAPSAYAPTVNPDLARQRQQEVLRKLVAYDYLDQGKATHLATRPTILAPDTGTPPRAM